VAVKKVTMSSAAERPLRCMVLFWLSFVLVLVLSPIGRCSCSIVVVLDCSTPRCSIQDRVGFSYREDGERESRTTESKDGSASRLGVRPIARLESRSITSMSTAALSTSTMGSYGVSARTAKFSECEDKNLYASQNSRPSTSLQFFVLCLSSHSHSKTFT
jgi:hypothetical protein